MITKSMWCGWKDDVTKKRRSFIGDEYFIYDENYLTWLIVLFIIMTPFTLMLDLIALPIEIIYFIALKIVRRVRNNG